MLVYRSVNTPESHDGNRFFDDPLHPKLGTGGKFSGTGFTVFQRPRESMSNMM